MRRQGARRGYTQQRPIPLPPSRKSNSAIRTKFGRTGRGFSCENRGAFGKIRLRSPCFRVPGGKSVPLGRMPGGDISYGNPSPYPLPANSFYSYEPALCVREGGFVTKTGERSAKYASAPPVFANLATKVFPWQGARRGYTQQRPIPLPPAPCPQIHFIHTKSALCVREGGYVAKTGERSAKYASAALFSRTWWQMRSKKKIEGFQKKVWIHYDLQ